MLTTARILDLAVLVAALPAGSLAAWIVRRETRGRGAGIVATTAAAIFVALIAELIMPSNYLLPVTVVLGWTLLVLALIDALSLRLPDVLTLPLAAAGLLLAFWLPDPSPLVHLIGAVSGFLALYAVAALHNWMRGHEGLGLGDAKLVAAAGAWLGWAALPSVVLIGCTAGLLGFGIAAARRGRKALSEQIPFGVPLCFAFWIVWLYGPIGF